MGSRTASRSNMSKTLLLIFVVSVAIAATLAAVEADPVEYGLAKDGGFLSPIEPMTWHHLERRSPQYRRRYRSYGRGRYGYGGYRRRGYYRRGYGVRKRKIAYLDALNSWNGIYTKDEFSYPQRGRYYGK